MSVADLKKAFAKLSAHNQPGLVESNLESTIKGTNHMAKGHGEQTGMPQPGITGDLWGQEPTNDPVTTSDREPGREALTQGAEKIHLEENYDLLRRTFDNMDAASKADKALIRQHFANGEPGKYVTRSKTLVEKVRDIAGRS